MDLYEQIHEFLSSLPELSNLDQFTSEFHLMWLELGRNIQQTLVQQKIEETETQYTGARTKREKRYSTPLGEMKLKRRVYPTELGLEIKVDQVLGLPKQKWLPSVLELACALGINSEFPNSHRLFAQWTRIDLTEKTLASTVEKTGRELQESEFNSGLKENLEEELSDERIYVGVDGVLTPLNQKQGYKEAKVGVIFWEKDYQRKKGGRGKIRKREYVATLKSREDFRERVQALYQLKGRSQNLREARDKLENYLNNNSTRIDYKLYLKQGLMIGSGVVESSNRRGVTQRLKQAGMHGSSEGAEGVMALRAAYLSHSNRWQNFWRIS